MNTPASHEQTLTLTVNPAGRVLRGRQGETIMEVCLAGGVRINAGCGGRGTCQKCRVRVTSGEVDVEPGGMVPDTDPGEGWVLACQARLAKGDVTVDLPSFSEERVVYSVKAPEGTGPFGPDRFGRDVFFRHGPLCTRVPLRPSKPTVDDPVTDFDRVVNALRQEPEGPSDYHAHLETLRTLSRVCRESGWDVQAWVSGLTNPPSLIRVEPADNGTGPYGVAIDIGTTSLSACLCDLENFVPMAMARCLNSQSVRGADVISRILFASNPEGLSELQGRVRDDMNALIGSVCKEAHVSPDRVTALSCAGNTTMTQIALGIDPTYIRKEPYVATTNTFPAARAQDLDLALHPDGVVHFLPCVSSYVGGDITAGTVACGMAEVDDISLLIDLGTNGEMVLGCADWLVCCSCSVGPAFEGSGITSGMLAEKGAVEDIEVTADGVKVRTVEDADPVGICGSGLIQAFSAFLQRGIIDRTATFQADAVHPNLRRTEEGTVFVVASGPDREVIITQPDLDNLLRSKAAVFAAARLLLRKMDLRQEDLSCIYVAGNFGRHLDFNDAVAIGLLPDLPRETFRFMGNTSLGGARAALGYVNGLEAIRKVAEKMTYIELSGDNAYHEEFVLATFLPHTELDLFPTVTLPGKGGKTS
jgi:uncharacterized 2Fe-2S/4Fe-4S cluster protein (DUF4445 family)